MAPSRKRQERDRKTWGQLVSDRRGELRLSQAQVAKMSGLPQQTISRVELDLVVPRYETMAKIARALGSSVETLFPIESYPQRLKGPRKRQGGSL